jgi:hypothetical protein
MLLRKGLSCDQWETPYQCTYLDRCSWVNAFATLDSSQRIFSSCYWVSDNSGNSSKCQAKDFCPILLSRDQSRRRSTSPWNETPCRNQPEIPQAKKSRHVPVSGAGLGQMLCEMHVHYYMAADISRYVQSSCTFLKARVTQDITQKHQYEMWVSLSPSCKISSDETFPCRPSNGLFLIKATANLHGERQYYSCWSGEQTDSIQYETVNGETRFNAGNVTCCSHGGQTNIIQVNFKVVFDEAKTSPFSLVKGLESLSHACTDATEPINVTITLPLDRSRGLMSNYSLPLLTCQVQGQTNQSLSIRVDDIVSCSIDMPVSVNGLGCLQNFSASALIVSISCRGLNSTRHEMKLNVSKQVNVSIIARPGCTIRFEGTYRPPRSDSWINVTSSMGYIIYTVIDNTTWTDVGKNPTSFGHTLLIIVIIVGIICIVAMVISGIVFIKKRKKSDPRHHTTEPSIDVIDLERGSNPLLPSASGPETVSNQSTNSDSVTVNSYIISQQSMIHKQPSIRERLSSFCIVKKIAGYRIH